MFSMADYHNEVVAQLGKEKSLKKPEGGKPTVDLLWRHDLDECGYGNGEGPFHKQGPWSIREYPCGMQVLRFTEAISSTVSIAFQCEDSGELERWLSGATRRINQYPIVKESNIILKVNGVPKRLPFDMRLHDYNAKFLHIGKEIRADAEVLSANWLFIGARVKPKRPLPEDDERTVEVKRVTGQ